MLNHNNNKWNHLRTNYDKYLDTLYNPLFSQNKSNFKKSFTDKQKTDVNIWKEEKKETYRTLAFDDPDNAYSYDVKYPEIVAYNQKPWDCNSIWNK